MAQNNRCRTFMGVLVGMLAFAVTAWSDFPEHGMYLGIYGGYMDKLGDWQLGNMPNVFNSAAPDNPKSSAVMGVRLGYHFTSWCILEAGGGYLPITSTYESSNTALKGDLDLYFQLIRGDFTPFIGLGIGCFQMLNGGDLGKDFDGQAHGSIGLRGLITPSIALRVEARDYAVEDFSSLGYGQNLEITGGIDFYLCGVQKKEMPPPAPAPAPAPAAAPEPAPAPAAPTLPPAPAAPALVEPANGDTGQEVSLNLSWASSNGAATYTVQVSTTPTFEPAMKSESDLDGLSSALADLAKNTTYYWRAGAENAGGKSGWSGVWSFTTVLPPPPPPPEVVKKFSGTIKGINFSSGTATILAGSDPILDDAVSVLKQYPSLRIHVDGHTDSSGVAATNQKLSEARAAAVRDYLVSKGIDGSRIETAGHGSSVPLESNKTSAGRAANRRIEFSIVSE